MTVRAASSDGVDLAIHDLGGDGPPLLFVHATGFHGWCYRRIATQLADIRHSWAPDLRGHGDSTTPANRRFEWAAMADDLLAVLDRLEIDEPVDFVGHSMGGATIAAVELRRPGTVRTAWLFEPIIFPPFDDGRDPSNLNMIARSRRADFDSYDAVIERYGSRPPLGVFDPDVLDDYVRHGFEPHRDGVTLKCRPEDEAATFEGITTATHAHLGELDDRFTIVGSGDGAPPAQAAPLIAERIPGATFQHWQNDTHFGPFADPDRAAAAIRTNLR